MNSPEGQSYGQSLPDQFDRTVGFFDVHLQAIQEVREIYKDFVTLEKEYVGKLQTLARKADERNTKLQSLIVVGEDPTKAWDDAALNNSTLKTAYSKLLGSLHDAARDHNDNSDALSAQVITPLKNLERKSDEQKKKAVQFYQKLLSDRERTYADRLKSKQKYDEECSEVETHRQKQSRAGDDRHADRAARQAEQQRADMLNSKNTYLISTAIANNAKSKFYSHDLPALEDELQNLQTSLVKRFSKIMMHAQSLQAEKLEFRKSQFITIEQSFGAVNPQADEAIFIDHNIRPFVPPNDWQFEPCSSHYDTGEMSVEPGPKVLLQNKLHKSRAKLNDLAPVLASKNQEVEQLSKLVEAYTADKSLGNLDEVTDSYLEACHQLAFFKSSEMTLTTEVETIVAAVGDDEGGQQPHTFKGSSFSIPTHCGYCKSSIWGLSKQGKTCKACGLSVHAKCELKVPADCSGATATGSTLSRQPTNASTLSHQSSTRSSIQQPPPSAATPSSFVTAQEPEDNEDDYQSARILFDFSPGSEFELGVSEGNVVYILEPDDGSGWVKVSPSPTGAGKNGLVPASYVELVGDSESAGIPRTTQAASDSAGSEKVRALYSYQSTGADELALEEGEVLTLSPGPTGGQHYAEGWWEGTNAQGRKGIFPGNYVELI